MTRHSRVPTWQRALIVLTSTFVAIVLVAVLYWARSVFIPLALAVFFTFLLSPLVTALQRLHLGRVSSVLVVVTTAAIVVGATGWLMSKQVRAMVEELPSYTENIKTKIKSIHEVGSGTLGERFQRMLDEISIGSQAAEKQTRATAKESEPVFPTAETPVPVTVLPERGAWITRLPTYMSVVVEPLGEAALAVVLVIFMLLKREDLRNRMIWLVGRGQITVTTKAFDDAGQRISRYLLMQFIVNGTYGLALSAGLLAIGVEHALLWGLLAAVLRYVPYIGAPLAGLFPIALSIVQFPGWWPPILVVSLVLVLELVSNNAMEPWLYGQSIGVSEVSLLIMAAFWTFLWGPIGLVLSGPLTVCLVVLGKYVPRLEFLAVLLGDQPALSPDVTLYQRLTAHDQDEGAEIVCAHVKEKGRDEAYDELLLPALSHVRRDLDRGDLSELDEKFIIQASSEILEEVDSERASLDSEEHDRQEPGTRVRVLGCPARDELDQLAFEMLRQMLDPSKFEVEVAPTTMLASELLPTVREKMPAVVCISSLPPGGLAHTRYVCKRLRSAFPDMRILVGRWGVKANGEQKQELLEASGADHVETSLRGACDHLKSWKPALAENRPETAANRSKKLSRQNGASDEALARHLLSLNDDLTDTTHPSGGREHGRDEGENQTRDRLGRRQGQESNREGNRRGESGREEGAARR